VEEEAASMVEAAAVVEPAAEEAPGVPAAAVAVTARFPGTC
jgi:hypothetical protein